MEYGFLSMLFPKNLEDQIRNNSKANMQDAANVLQYHIYDGLTFNLNKKIKIFNVVPVGSFPQYYNKPFISKSVFAYGNNQDNINIGFCNIKLVRKFAQEKAIYKSLKNWCSSSNEEKTLFMYTLSATFLKAVFKIKRQFKNISVCAIVADLPNMSSLSSKKSFVQRLFSVSQSNASYSRLSCVDSYVLLTEHMADYLKIKNKPYCVMEGIATEINKFVNLEKEESKIKRILYSGTLHKRFGVMNLLKAFEEIKNDNYRLQLCGVGDCEDEIKRLALKDNRIEFFGQLPRNKVLELQQKATVLVNPRQNNEEFTKYSFPSKILEYLSSGTPVIAYKLDGMPDDYDKYIHYVDNNEINTLKNKIIEICELEDFDRFSYGKKAREYVLSEKNYIVQTKKIVSLLNGEKGRKNATC